MFTDASEYPVFDAGMSAKGFIAVGMNARGIVCLSMMGEGIITISMLGYGLVFFVGQVGATLGFGIYQLGVAWYCYAGQFTLSFWDTKAAQCGINLIGPYLRP